jgi:hypothetical protein
MNPQDPNTILALIAELYRNLSEATSRVAQLEAELVARDKAEDS